MRDCVHRLQTWHTEDKRGREHYVPMLQSCVLLDGAHKEHVTINGVRWRA